MDNKKCDLKIAVDIGSKSVIDKLVTIEEFVPEDVASSDYSGF